MKIALITNYDQRNDQLTNLGLTQACYLIQKALGWFDPTARKDLFAGTRIFTTQKPYDITPASIVANYGYVNAVIQMEFVNSLWCSGGDIDDRTGRSKAVDLAERIAKVGKEYKDKYFLVFAWFSIDHNVIPFLDYFGIATPKKWPKHRQPALIRIDTEAKTIEIDYVPYSPKY